MSDVVPCLFWQSMPDNNKCLLVMSICGHYDSSHSSTSNNNYTIHEIFYHTKTPKRLKLCFLKSKIQLYTFYKQHIPSGWPCKSSVLEPVEAFGGGIGEPMRNGFVLKWKASNCSFCEGSGGNCGFDYIEYHFKCFCPDRPHVWSCSTGQFFSKIFSFSV
uniref:Wall-associated receptor kinase C-terminal domain-containing protein n=1 Tax=Quercus lobata TaxID=97700 RepID=A0A7N2L908_QUELO